MIVVFGSVNMDTIVSAEYLPNAGETITCKSRLKNEGGKGANQAVAAAKMGNNVRFYGAVGQDLDGNLLLENFQSYGIDISGVNIVSEVSGAAYVIVAKDAENSIVYYPGANSYAKASFVHDSVLNENCVVLMQMEIPSAENWKLALRAKARKATVVLNAAPASYIPDEAYNTIDILIINQNEARAIASQYNIAHLDYNSIAEYINNRFHIICIITLGKDGVVAVSNTEVYKVPALLVNSVDTTCAGDAFVGTFVAYLDNGYSLRECLLAGNIAGALTTMRRGSQKSMPAAAEIRQVIRSKALL